MNKISYRYKVVFKEPEKIKMVSTRNIFPIRKYHYEKYFREFYSINDTSVILPTFNNDTITITTFIEMSGNFKTQEFYDIIASNFYKYKRNIWKDL